MLIVAIAASFLSTGAGACSIHGIKLFELSPVGGERIAVATPDVELLGVQRGYSDGNPGSCSDAGVLRFSVESTNLGYRFKVLSGNIDPHTFPDDFVTSVDASEGVLMFAWLDDPRLPKSDLDGVIEVIAMDRFGNQSDATQLRVTQTVENTESDGLPLPEVSVPSY